MKLLHLFLYVHLLILSLDAKDLKQESSLVQGTLDNGFRYTLKKNAKPEKKAEIRLLVNAGSLEEDEDQKGVAHLVEHMAFNGTKHFVKNELISYLESIGVAFGSHLNASTGTTKTLYKLSIPLEKDNFEKSFLIFEDWANGLNFDKNELEKERGVILEEARSRDNANFRIYQQAKNTLYADSKYKDRTPIGDLEIIKNIKVDRVKDFYDDWYRPELMHLVIVGEIDLNKTKSLIHKHFSSLKNRSKRQPANRSVPKVDKQRVLFVNDKELSTRSVDMYYFENIKKVTTIEHYKEKLLQKIALNIFNLEHSNQLSKKTQILNSLRASKFKLGSNLEGLVFSASYDHENPILSLKHLSKNIFTHNKYGFDKENFNAVINSLKHSNELFFKTLGNAESASYANKIVSNLLNKTLFIDETFKYHMQKDLLQNIRLHEVNEAYKKMLKTASKLVAFSFKKPSVLSKQEIFDTINNTKLQLTPPTKKKKLPSSVLTKELQTLPIRSQHYNKEFDFWELHLANGIKLIYKHNDYTKNKVIVKSFSKGGYSLLHSDLLENAKSSASLVSKSGLATYSLNEVKKIYANKSAYVQPYISRFSEGFAGASSKKDFNTLLELIYLAHTEFKVDANIVNNSKKRALKNLQQLNDNPKLRFSREYSNFYMGNHPRYLQKSTHSIKSIDPQKLSLVFKDRFLDPQNFVYIITGDISYESVKETASKYLANLPVTQRDETYQDRGIRSIKGNQRFIRSYENRNISNIKLSYCNESNYSLKKAVQLSFLKEVLNIKLREFIREEKSGVYGVHVGSSFKRLPNEYATIEISFSCDPMRKDELVSYVKQTIKQLQNKPINQSYIDAIKKKKIIAIEQSMKTADFWQYKLYNYAFYNDDLKKINQYKSLYNSVDPLQIQNTAKHYLNAHNVVHSELNPKGIFH